MDGFARGALRPVLLVALCLLVAEVFHLLVERPATMLSRRLGRWIGNGVLDRFLEDESLFGEFLRTPVSEGGVEPLVVGPPHVVVEVGA